MVRRWRICWRQAGQLYEWWDLSVPLWLLALAMATSLILARHGSSWSLSTLSNVLSMFCVQCPMFFQCSFCVLFQCSLVQCSTCSSMTPGVNLTTEGKQHLEAAFGEKSTNQLLRKRKVRQWVSEVEELAIHHGQDSPSDGLCSIPAWHGQQTDIPYENCKSHTTLATATWGRIQAASSTNYYWKIRHQWHGEGTHCSASPPGWHGYSKPYCHITNRTQSSLRVTVPLVDAIIEQRGQCNSNTIAKQHQRGGRKMKHSFNHSYHQTSRNWWKLQRRKSPLLG